MPPSRDAAGRLRVLNRTGVVLSGYDERPAREAECASSVRLIHVMSPIGPRDRRNHLLQARLRSPERLGRALANSMLADMTTGASPGTSSSHFEAQVPTRPRQARWKGEREVDRAKRHVKARRCPIRTLPSMIRIGIALAFN